MTARTASLAVALAAAPLVLAACGGDEPAQTVTQTQTVQARTQTQTQTTATTTPTATTGTGFGVGGAGQATEGDPGAAAVGADGTGQTGSLGEGAIVRPFSNTSPWNTPVTEQPTDERSDRFIRLAQERRGVEERGTAPPRVTTDRRNGRLFVNTRKWSTPIVDEENGVETTVICRQIPPQCGDGRDVRSLVIPPDESPLPQYDGWFTVLNRRQGVAYDLWRARRARGGGNVMSYQFMRKWDLNGPGFQQPNRVSARGSGLPLFAGVILPEEIRAGRIDHALAISLPGPANRNYVQPASSTNGVGRLTSIPEGARIRLKRGRRVERLPGRTNRRAARAIYTALRRYGAIVVDRSANPTLYAKQNADWRAPLRGADGRLLDSRGRPLDRFERRRRNAGTPLLRGNEVSALRITDFEVVELPPILKFPPLGNAALAPTIQATPVVP